MIQAPFSPPPLPPGGFIPPPGPLYQFLACVVLVLWVMETLLMLLPRSLQRKVNLLRFGPYWPGQFR